MTKWGDQRRGVEAYYNQNFVPGVIAAIEKVIEHGQDQIKEDVEFFVHEVSGNLKSTVRKLKIKKTRWEIRGVVRMGGKKVGGKDINYAGAEEIRHKPMRSAAKFYAPKLRAQLEIEARAAMLK